MAAHPPSDVEPDETMMRNRRGRCIGAGSLVLVAFLLLPVGAAAQSPGDPSPTIATTEPQVPVSRTEETTATEARLRTIVTALAALGGALVVANLVFWGVTRPARRQAAEVAPTVEPAVGVDPPTDASTATPATAPATPVPLSALVAPAPTGPAPTDEGALVAARQLFDRLGTVPDMDAGSFASPQSGGPDPVG